jgi:hypothetical protein
VLPIHATPVQQGEFAGRWRSIDVVIDPNLPVVRSAAIQGVMVEHGQMVCADLDAFGQFRMWDSLDGLADFVFWGKDAPAIAEKFQAPRLDDRNYGWVNVPEAEIGKLAKAVQDRIASEKLYAAVDYRPHRNLEKLNAQIRHSGSESGHVQLAGVAACGFRNGWGDGIFTVARDFDAADRLVRIRLDVGNDETQSRMGRVLIMSMAAIVTRKILDGEPIGFAERLKPQNPRDSGWALSSGTETQRYMDDAKNLSIVQLAALVGKDPELGKIIDAPVGSVFRRAASGFVPDE